MQLTSVPSILRVVDVDKDRLASLEEEIFEKIGISGNSQCSGCRTSPRGMGRK